VFCAKDPERELNMIDSGAVETYLALQSLDATRIRFILEIGFILIFLKNCSNANESFSFFRKKKSCKKENLVKERRQLHFLSFICIWETHFIFKFDGQDFVSILLQSFPPKDH
jgi:hypothetical protein